MTYRPPLLQIQKLRKFYLAKDSLIRAIDNLSLEIYEGETLGLVGESGCGKSTLAKLLLRLENPTEGSLHFGSYNLNRLTDKEKNMMCRKMQIVFQDPFGSLSPRLSIADIIAEGLEVHQPHLNEKERETLVSSALRDVGLDPETRYRYPHDGAGARGHSPHCAGHSTL